MKKIILLVGFILVVFALGCTLKNPLSNFVALNDSGWTPQGVNSIAEANNKFAVDLYKKYSSEFENQNVFFSPYSISSAFAMVYEGARGKTRYIDGPCR